MTFEPPRYAETAVLASDVGRVFKKEQVRGCARKRVFSEPFEYAVDEMDGMSLVDWNWFKRVSAYSNPIQFFHMMHPDEVHAIIMFSKKGSLRNLKPAPVELALEFYKMKGEDIHFAHKHPMALKSAIVIVSYALMWIEYPIWPKCINRRIAELFRIGHRIKFKYGTTAILDVWSGIVRRVITDEMGNAIDLVHDNNQNAYALDYVGV